MKDAARRYCREIEGAAGSSDIGFLRRINGLLPELYWRAQALPDINPWAGTSDEEFTIGYEAAASAKEHHLWRERYRLAGETVRHLLGTRGWYWAVFDPFEKNEGLQNSLADDLADIYADLMQEFSRDESSGEDSTERLWHWRWAFANHWGKYHLPRAMNAICWLVYDKWDEDKEAWSETETAET